MTPRERLAAKVAANPEYIASGEYHDELQMIQVEERFYQTYQEEAEDYADSWFDFSETVEYISRILYYS